MAQEHGIARIVFARPRRRLAAALLALCLAAPAAAAVKPRSAECVLILQDEAGWSPRGYVSRGDGAVRSLVLANLLGHWPAFEVRVRPIWDYAAGDADACRATLYVGSADDTAIPAAFLDDFFATKKRIAWLGLGTDKLDQDRLAKAFHHRAEGVIAVDRAERDRDGLFDTIAYRDSSFRSVPPTGDDALRPATAMRYVAAEGGAAGHVLAWQVHSRTGERIPYFLRAGNRFLVADTPLEADDLQENSRYFAFADLLFDILDIAPYRKEPVAVGRLEDIHPVYDVPLFKAAVAALEKEGVPINVAHIPFFADPRNAYGLGPIKVPKPATDSPELVAVLKDIARDPRNAILWHGVTHQLGDTPNVTSATTAVDYEFWNAVGERPVDGDGPTFVLDRLATGLAIFDAYGIAPRYWETPHYSASAVDNVVFGRVFPWVIGRSDYYASSIGDAFTLPAVARDAGAAMPGVTREVIDTVRATSFSGVDHLSTGRVSQIFPFEIYRDIYGQRILPETLGYVAAAASGPVPADVDAMLGDARNNRVVRDVWGAFFFHPYLLTAKAEGGIGAFRGDAGELTRLVAGLKALGYRFIALPDFEKSLPGK